MSAGTGRDGLGGSAPVTITGVSGGAALEARYDALEHLAGRYVRTGADLAGWAILPATTLVDPDLLASAVLAPLTFAHVEALLTGLLTGTDGLALAATAWEATAAAVLLARTALEEVDRGEVQRLWVDAGQMLFLESPGDAPLDRLTSALAGAGGLITAALGPYGVRLGARGVSALLYGPERPATTRATAVHVRGQRQAPRDVADLVRHLGLLADMADGSVEVQTLVGADGAVRHVVYLPGTDDMNPFSRDGQVRDMQENIRLMAGEPTAYGDGVLAAMAQAGVRPGEPVLLVGHSQGGMEAVALAAHGTPYTVTDVVTFGSPTGQIGHYPPGVQVLSLEHVGDLVPELDGTPAAPDPAQVTVRFDDGVEGLLDNHSYLKYTDGAQAVDASRDPTIRLSITGLHGFLAPGQHMHAEVFQITRSRS